MTQGSRSLESIRESLGHARELLTKPQLGRLEEAIPHLEAAARELREAGGGLPELESLHRELDDLRKCTEHTAAFYLGLHGLVLSTTGSYNSAGGVTPPAGCHSLSLEV